MDGSEMPPDDSQSPLLPNSQSIKPTESQEPPNSQSPSIALPNSLIQPPSASSETSNSITQPPNAFLEIPNASQSPSIEPPNNSLSLTLPPESQEPLNAPIEPPNSLTLPPNASLTIPQPSSSSLTLPKPPNSSLTLPQPSNSALLPPKSASLTLPPNTYLNKDPPSTGSATGNPKNKVALRPGRSLMDWVRLGHSGVDLTGVGGKLIDVNKQQLAKHNKRKDCWMALKGKVYNVTAYLEFHPGGEDELMKGAGIDATTLFNEVHKWVNFETMLQKCIVGRYVETRSFFAKPSILSRPKSSKKSTSSQSSSAIPSKSSANSANNPSAATSGAPPWPSAPTPLPTPKYDWFQSSDKITMVIYTRWSDICKSDVVFIKNNEIVKVVCYIQDMCYTLHVSLSKAVTEECSLRISSGGKVEVNINKEQTSQRWSGLGKTLPRHGEYIKTRDREVEFIECKIVKKTEVTHDSRLFVIEVPKPSIIPVPIGFHVYISIPGKELDLMKPYTPVAPALKVGPTEEEGRYIHLYIKIYKEGELTPLLEELNVGSMLSVSLPEGNFTKHRLTAATSTANCLVLLAAGTGITPMIKLLLAAISNSKNVHLLFFNKTEEDIAWRQELNELAQEYSSLFKVTHILSQGGKDWNGEIGRINTDLIQRLIPSSTSDQKTFICACGPTPFTKLALSLVQESGHTTLACHAFLA